MVCLLVEVNVVVFSSGSLFLGEAEPEDFGGIWLVWLLGHSVSIAIAVSFIALAGVAAEFGVVMLIYQQQASTETPSTRTPRGPRLPKKARRECRIRRTDDGLVAQ